MLDAPLEERWRGRRPPFDQAFVAFDELPAAELRDLLERFVEILEVECGGVSLNVGDDWHEHDGVILGSSRSSWRDLRECVATLDALRNSSPEDWAVRKGWYDEGNHFYLRWLMQDDWIDNGIAPAAAGGCVDVSCSTALASQIVEAAKAGGLTPALVEDAASYFDREWGG